MITLKDLLEVFYSMDSKITDLYYCYKGIFFEWNKLLIDDMELLGTLNQIAERLELELKLYVGYNTEYDSCIKYEMYEPNNLEGNCLQVIYHSGYIYKDSSIMIGIYLPVEEQKHFSESLTFEQSDSIGYRNIRPCYLSSVLESKKPANRLNDTICYKISK